MFSLLLAVFGCFLVSAAPAGRALICPIEDLPWTLNITIFNVSSSNTAKPSTGMGMGMSNDTIFLSESFIDFTFCDSNEGLELEMECSRFTNGSLSDDDHFYPCDEPGLAFKLSGHTLKVQRGYKSPCLGEPPYDNAIAFGQADLDPSLTESPDGTLATQISLQMPISSISSKHQANCEHRSRVEGLCAG